MIVVYFCLKHFGYFQRRGKQAFNKLRKRRPATTDLESPEPERNEVEIKADDSLDPSPTRLHQQSHQLKDMSAIDEGSPSSFAPPQHRLYCGVIQQKPLYSPQRHVFDIISQRGNGVAREHIESSTRARFRSRVRNLMNPNQAPVPEVQPLDHLPPGRSLRRISGLEDIRRLFKEQGEKSNSGRVRESVPKSEPPAIQESSTAHGDKVQKSEDLENPTEPLELDDYERESFTSQVGYESEAVIENARAGLRTSVHAAAVVPADQGSAEEAQPRDTSTISPLVRRSLDTESNDKGISDGRKISRVSWTGDVEEGHEPAASSSAIMSAEAAHFPVCRIGNLTDFIALTPVQSGQPSASIAAVPQTPDNPTIFLSLAPVESVRPLVPSPATIPLPESPATEDRSDSSSPNSTSAISEILEYYSVLYS